MTREVKLSLIFAFALVLVVGVLLSDHLSGARKATLDGMNPDRGIAMEGTAEIPSTSPELILVNEQGQPIDPPVKSMPPARQEREPVYRPWPVLTADGTPPSGPVPVDASGEVSLLAKLQSRMVQGAQNAVNDLAAGDVPLPSVSLTNDFRLETPSPEGDGMAESTVSTLVFEEKPTTAAPTFTLYEVREGDTLWSIASSKLGDGRRYKELLDFNKDRISSSGTLRAGSSIRIPLGETVSTNAKSEPVRKPSTAIASANESKARKNEPAKKSAKGTYTVKSGDTLGAIAARTLGSSARYEDLLLANADKLSDEHSISPGMVLTIPQR